MMVDENAGNSGPKPKHDETAEDKSLRPKKKETRVQSITLNMRPPILLP